MAAVSALILSLANSWTKTQRQLLCGVALITCRLTSRERLITSFAWIVSPLTIASLNAAFASRRFKYISRRPRRGSCRRGLAGYTSQPDAGLTSSVIIASRVSRLFKDGILDRYRSRYDQRRLCEDQRGRVLACSATMRIYVDPSSPERLSNAKES
jgi:hypothetical protein